MPKRNDPKPEAPKIGILSEDIIRRFEDAFSLGCSDAEACCFAGVTLQVFQEHLKADPAFKDRREILKQRPQLLARQTIFKALKEDPQIALEYLDRVSGR
jgi:hypothetical protein